MDFGVCVVEDHELPAGIKRVMVERPGDRPLLLLARSRNGTWDFAQDWQRHYGNGGPREIVAALEEAV